MHTYNTTDDNNSHTIKLLYINLGLDTFDDIKDVISNDKSTRYKTCIEQYARSHTICHDKPDPDTIVENFKSLDPDNVNTYFACNPFTFMPYITAVSDHLLQDIDAIHKNTSGIDVFVAGEMCRFDYETNYKNNFTQNFIKEYTRKTVNASHLFRTQKQNQPIQHQSKQYQPKQQKQRHQTKNKLSYQVKGSTDLPVIGSDIDSAIITSIAALGYDKEYKNMNKTTFSTISEDSKKLFFVGVTKHSDLIEQPKCDDAPICDELQIVKAVIKHKRYIIINVHNRTFATTNFDQYIDLFIKFITNVTKQFPDHNIVVMGDFNIGKNNSDVLKQSVNTINTTSTTPINQFINRMKQLNFTNTSIVNAYAAYETACNSDTNKTISKNVNILVFYKLKGNFY